MMDEPTSAIDPIAQEKLFDAIAELFQDKTAILISHRMSSVRLCEKIVFSIKASLLNTEHMMSL